MAQDHTKKVLGLYHLILDKKWGISPKKAFNMIQDITQHGVHTVLHLSLSRQFRTIDHQLLYRRLLHKVYSDTLFATTVSRRSNRCAQIFATNFDWPCSIPIKLKNKVHDAPSLLFQWGRVPPAVICDNAKEMILEEFNQKLNKALCHLKQMEPFTPWLNAAKREVNELKKRSSRKLIKSITPKRLWNDCLELESYIRSNTLHAIYKLDGDVSKSIMSGKMSNISQFSEFEWFEWVMF